jgi:hypothetical protein
MRFRKLRIAWSVFWGLACVLLTILWMRSYHYYDGISYNLPTIAPEACWCDGLLHMGFMKVLPATDGGPLRPFTYPISRMERWQKEIQYKHTNVLGFGAMNGSIEFVLITPFWCPWIVTGICSALLWPSKKWSFSVRALLIAATLVALVLGLAVYAASY